MPSRPRPERLSRNDRSLASLDQPSAYAESAEGDKGTLDSGKLADLAVLSQDIFTVPPQQLRQTVSILTMVGGAIVYDARLLTAH